LNPSIAFFRVEDAVKMTVKDLLEEIEIGDNKIIK